MSRTLKWSALLAAGIAGPCWAAGSTLVVQASPLAGFRHYAAASVWAAMRPGDPLELEREPDNLHDPMAVRVSWRGHVLGYLPRHDNDHVAGQLDRGQAIRARIVKLVEHRNRSRRLVFEIYVDL